VAELVDAIGLGPIRIYPVGVRLSPWAHLLCKARHIPKIQNFFKISKDNYIAA